MHNRGIGVAAGAAVFMLCVLPPRAQAQTLGDAFAPEAFVFSFLGFTGLVSPELRKVQRVVKRTPKAFELLREAGRCESLDQGALQCTLDNVVIPGVCFAFATALGGRLGPFHSQLGFGFSAVCNGSSPLKCCLRPGGCATAFNEPFAINCEGSLGGGGLDVGPCAPRGAFPGDPGCFCDYIPLCAINPVERPGGGTFLLNQLASDMAKRTADLIRENPAAARAFATGLGSRELPDLLDDHPPFSGPDALPPGIDLPEVFVVNDDDDEERTLRALIGVIIRRIWKGIPGFEERFAIVGVRNWSEQEKAAYLAGTDDPEGILRRLLTDFGLEIFQRAAPNTWELFAVPAPGEAPGANDVPFVGGLVPGGAPEVTLVVDGETLEVTVDDPDRADNPEGAYAMVIDWGDGRVEHAGWLAGDPATHQLSHAFAAAGAHDVRVAVMNTSGAIGAASAQVQIAAADPNPPPATVDRLTLSFRARVASAQTHGAVEVRVEAEDRLGQRRPLGRAYGEAPAAAPGGEVLFELDGAIPNEALAEIFALHIFSEHRGAEGVQSSELRLGEVRLHLRDGQTRGLFPGADDTRVFLSPASAPRVDPATGELLLPLGEGETVVYLQDAPATSAPAAGCRPDYEDPRPPMRSAAGGCELIADGTVYSARSAGLFDRQGAIDYCDALEQGGFDDWRLAEQPQLEAVADPPLAATHFTFPLEGLELWTATDFFGQGVVFDIAGDARRVVLPSTQAPALCVRERGPEGPGTALGQACGAGGDCASGLCAGGVCCSVPCEDSCASCNEDGTCVADTGSGCDDRGAGGTCDAGVCIAPPIPSPTPLPSVSPTPLPSTSPTPTASVAPTPQPVPASGTAGHVLLALGLVLGVLLPTWRRARRPSAGG